MAHAEPVRVASFQYPISKVDIQLDEFLQHVAAGKPFCGEHAGRRLGRSRAGSVCSRTTWFDGDAVAHR
jgi:hypothetical protein